MRDGVSWIYRFQTCTAISCGDERGESSFAVTLAAGMDVDGVGVCLGAGAGDFAGVVGAAFGAGDGAADFLAMAKGRLKSDDAAE